ncbi:MAG: type II toxin-antitoxin system HicB family antitoxin [Proteobacteria bacterium]|nr:type II toxin-antitoxin system HicB family antitoxin [Pseudomonadota bacterium]
MLTYKGYMAHVEFDDDLDIFSGGVINTRDVITFQGSSVSELKKAFVDSVEDYLSFCAERNESPEKPFSGRFNVRLDPLLHQQIAFVSKKEGVSINQWVAHAIRHQLHEHS